MPGRRRGSISRSTAPSSPTRAPARIPEHGGGRRRGLQVLHLRHRSQALPAHPAALLHDCFAAIAPTGLTAGVHNETTRAVRACHGAGAGRRHHRLARPRPVAPADHRAPRHDGRSTRSARRRAARPTWCIARSAAATTSPPATGRRASTASIECLHPLPGARRGERRPPARRQGQDQPADPPAAPRSRSSGGTSPPATSRWSPPIT